MSGKPKNLESPAPICAAPKEPGWYWLKGKHAFEADLVKVCINPHGILYALIVGKPGRYRLEPFDRGYQWFGPIPEPGWFRPSDTLACLPFAHRAGDNPWGDSAHYACRYCGTELIADGCGYVAAGAKVDRGEYSPCPACGEYNIVFRDSYAVATGKVSVLRILHVFGPDDEIVCNLEGEESRPRNAKVLAGATCLTEVTRNSAQGGREVACLRRVIISACGDRFFVNSDRFQNFYEGTLKGAEEALAGARARACEIQVSPNLLQRDGQIPAEAIEVVIAGARRLNEATLCDGGQW